MTLICDTSVVYAALDRTDISHASCASLLGEADVVVVPAPVVTEVDWLGRTRRSPKLLGALLTSIEDRSVDIVDLERADYTRVRELCEQYRDLPLGFVDAAVISVAERLGEPKVATLDHRHFAVVRPKHVRALQLLPD